jgi:hemoglobin
MFATSLFKITLSKAPAVFASAKFSATAAAPTILERLDAWSTKTLNVDGDKALEVAVDKFYDRALIDPGLIKYFEGQDPAKLRRHQFNFMRSAFSNGKYTYKERTMEVAHDKLFKMGLGGKEFDLVAKNLVDALNSLNVPADIVTDVVGVVGPLRPIFVAGYEKYHGKN